MTRFRTLMIAVFTFLLTLPTFAADAVAAVVAADPDSAFLDALLKSMGDFKGASGLALAIIVVQLLMKFLDSSYFELVTNSALYKKYLPPYKGKIKLLALTLFSMIFGILTLMSSGVPLSAALLNSATLATAQVFIHQWMKPEKAPAEASAPDAKA